MKGKCEQVNQNQVINKSLFGVKTEKNILVMFS